MDWLILEFSNLNDSMIMGVSRLGKVKEKKQHTWDTSSKYHILYIYGTSTFKNGRNIFRALALKAPDKGRPGRGTQTNGKLNGKEK